MFAGATILYSALWMYAVRHATAPVELGFNSEYLAKYRAYDVQNVQKDSPAEKAGLQIGDRIVAINGRGLDSTSVFDEIWYHSRPGDSVTLTVERPGRRGTMLLHGTFRAARQQSNEGGLARESANEITSSFPVLFLVVGLTVLFLRVDDPNAWLLALLFSGFIAVPGTASLAALSRELQVFANAYRAIFLGLFGALFYLFFAVFPARSPLERRVPWLKWAGFLAGACFALPGLRVGDIRAPAMFDALIGEHAASRIVSMYIYLFFSLGIVSLAGNARSPVPGVRRKTRVIFWGTIAGLLPATVERVAIDFWGFQPPFWIDKTVILVVLTFPLSFAYAVVKHQVMEIPVLLKRSARYLLVRQGFVLIIALVINAGFLLFLTVFTRFYRVPFYSALTAGTVVGIILGMIAMRANSYVRRRIILKIDQAFFRSAYDARVILQALAEKARAVTDREKLANLLELQIEGALHPKSQACYLEDGYGNLVAVGKTAPRGQESDPAPPPRPEFPFRFGAIFIPREADRIPTSLPLLEEIAQRGKVWEVPQGSEAAGDVAPECLVPILGRNSGLAGLLVLGRRRSEEPYSSEDKQLLESVASQAGIALENIGLAEKMAERIEADRRAALEMDIARRVQARLFPQKLPALKTLEYAGGCLQARQVGGDYYDFLDMGPAAMGIVLADISGKGISGALLMANLQANLRSQYAVALDDLPRLLQSVNRLFYENTTDESYATMFFGVYDDSSRILRYANCGHVAPLIVHLDGTVQYLTSTTTVLGLFLNWESPIQDVRMQPGDVLVICTDGVTEAPNAQQEEYGQERLARLLLKNKDLPVDELLAAIQASVQEFSGGSQADDITLIVARCR